MYREMARDEDRIYQIATFCERVEAHIGTLEQDAFQDDLKTVDAVSMMVVAISEQAQKLTEGFKERNTDIPWHKIIGMRHRLAHDYTSLNVALLYTVATVDIPTLRELLKQVRY